MAQRRIANEVLANVLLENTEKLEKNVDTLCKHITEEREKLLSTKLEIDTKYYYQLLERQEKITENFEKKGQELKQKLSQEMKLFRYGLISIFCGLMLSAGAVYMAYDMYSYKHKIVADIEKENTIINSDSLDKIKSYIRLTPKQYKSFENGYNAWLKNNKTKK